MTKINQKLRKQKKEDNVDFMKTNKNNIMNIKDKSISPIINAPFNKF